MRPADQHARALRFRGVFWYDVNPCNGHASKPVTFDAGTAAFGYSINVFDGNGNQVGWPPESHRRAAVVALAGPARAAWRTLLRGDDVRRGPRPAAQPDDGGGLARSRGRNGSQVQLRAGGRCRGTLRLPPCGSAIDCDGT